jgi:hypothetical protein
MLITEKRQVYSTSQRQIYPRLVEDDEFGLLQRLKARITTMHVGNKLFLGYCKQHKKYFLDYEHMDGNIRCPTCDKIWLMDHGFYEYKVPVRQRYWIKRKDGIKQRYWKNKQGCYKKTVQQQIET